jgi:hypothetical protein
MHSLIVVVVPHRHHARKGDPAANNVAMLVPVRRSGSRPPQRLPMKCSPGGRGSLPRLPVLGNHQLRVGAPL